jgi:hypothetical protein
VNEEIEKYKKELADKGWEITVQETNTPLVNLQRFIVIIEEKG